MTTNLRLAIADIPYNSMSVTASATLEGFCSPWDIVAGPRYRLVQFAADSASDSYTFDLGADFESGNASANYFIVAHADLAAVTGTTTVKLQRSDDGSSFTDVCDSSAVGSLLGPKSADYLGTFNSVGPYRYWRVLWANGTADQKYPHSKVFFGTLFNFTYDCDYSFKKIIPGNQTFYASSGAAYNTRNAEPYYRFEFTWPHQTDAVAKSFDDNVIARARECPIFLVNTTQTQILDSQQLIHAELVDSRITKEWNGVNTIYAKFEEIVA